MRSGTKYCMFWQDCVDGKECPAALTPKRLWYLWHRSDAPLEEGVDIHDRTPWCFDPKLLQAKGD